MKKELQSNVNGMTSGGGSIQHPFSIHWNQVETTRLEPNDDHPPPLHDGNRTDVGSDVQCYY